jgi:hypothetical protein
MFSLMARRIGFLLILELLANFDIEFELDIPNLGLEVR